MDCCLSPRCLSYQYQGVVATTSENAAEFTLYPLVPVDDQHHTALDRIVNSHVTSIYSDHETTVGSEGNCESL